MSDELKYKIYSPTECIPEQTMFDYIDHTLTPKEEHQVEKHMLDCELCSDALEGLRMVKDRGRIHIINEAVKARLAVPDKKIVPFNFKLLISVAAGIALLICGVFFFNQMTDKKEAVAELKAPEAEKTLEETNVSPAPQELTTTPPAPVTTETTENEPVPATGESEKKEEKAQDREGTKNQLEQQTAFGNNGVSKEVVTAADEVSIPPASKQAKDLAEKDDKKAADNTNISFTTNGAASDQLDEQQNFELSKTKNSEKDKLKQPDDSKTTDKVVQTKINSNEGLVSGSVQMITKSDNNAKPGYIDENKKNRAQKAEDKPSISGNVAYAPVETESTITQSKQDNDQDVSYMWHLADSTGSGEAEEKVYAVVDEMPKYPGGETELMKYIQKNMEFRSINKEDATIGSYYLQFIVDSHGKASHAKFLKPVDKETEKMFVALVDKMPLWTPGKLNGKPVSVLFNLPVKMAAK